MARMQESTISRPVEKTALAERRRHARSQLLCRAFGILDLPFGVSGQIMNVSQEGLGLRYVATREHTTKASLVSILLLLAEQSIYYNSLPVEAIWDCRLRRYSPCDLVAVRCCGVRFRNMSRAHELDLRHFINNYTTGAL